MAVPQESGALTMRVEQFYQIAVNKGRFSKMLDTNTARQYYKILHKQYRYNPIPHKNNSFRLTNGLVRWTFTPKPEKNQVHVLAMTIN